MPNLIFLHMRKLFQNIFDWRRYPACTTLNIKCNQTSDLFYQTINERTRGRITTINRDAGVGQLKTHVKDHLGRKVSLDLWRQRRPWSDCASAQSDQGLRCPLTFCTPSYALRTSDTTECMSGEQMPGWYFAHAPDDLILRILRMLEDTFLLD